MIEIIDPSDIEVGDCLVYTGIVNQVAYLKVFKIDEEWIHYIFTRHDDVVVEDGMEFKFRRDNPVADLYYDTSSMNKKKARKALGAE